MAAYQRAIEQGADAIEPDLVITSDGVLVCRHENEISKTTDVADRSEFAARRRDQTVDGRTANGWWVEDFTLAELKTLRAKERLPKLRPANTAFDGQEPIPTFEEVCALARDAGIGIYAELKHVAFFKGIGFDIPAALTRSVSRMGGQRVADAMVVQSFEIAALRALPALSPLRWRIVQIMAPEGGPVDAPAQRYAEMCTNAGLAQIRTYAMGINVEKGMIVPRDAAERALAPTDLVARAHEAGLHVSAWTFRAENRFLPTELRRGDASAPDYLRQHGDLGAELRAFYPLGVDAVLCDFPEVAVAARA